MTDAFPVLARPPGGVEVRGPAGNRERDRDLIALAISHRPSHFTARCAGATENANRDSLLRVVFVDSVPPFVNPLSTPMNNSCL